MNKDEILDEIVAELSIKLYVRNGKLNVELLHGDRVLSKDFVHLSDLNDDV